MEAGASEAEAMFASRKLTEVFGRPGDNIVVKLENYLSGGFGVDSHVELQQIIRLSRRHI